jgi:thymidylate synthase (FAD)
MVPIGLKGEGEVILINRIDVLDHGYIELLDQMGDDWTPVKAARLSFNNGLKGEEADTKLLRFLMKNKHTSPFEQVMMTWEVQLPIFVAREWVRHRTAKLNEFSMRYAEASKLGEGEIKFYFPNSWRSQHPTNKQASGIELDARTQWEADKVYAAAVWQTIRAYDDLLSLGVSREMARFVLPVSVYTKMVWTNDLHNTLHFLDLRDSDAAQDEIHQYATAMRTIMEEKLPVIMSIWREQNGHQ